MPNRHVPVLLTETLQYLKPHPQGIYLDGTVGGGGHARVILETSRPTGRLLGLDRDPTALERTRVRLTGFGERVRLELGSYEQIKRLASGAGFDRFDGVLLDLGLSSDQLADPTRGFSFQTVAPLDLRFDSTAGRRAAELLARWSRNELAEILGRYGELRAPRRLAERILAGRAQAPIKTTDDLIKASGLMDPRRRAQLFQALRIATNDELGTLERALPNLWEALKPGGRLVVISFHSLEDRIVKWFFRAQAAAGAAEILTKKPITPTAAEIAANPSCRSAKLRAIEKRIANGE